MIVDAAIIHAVHCSTCKLIASMSDPYPPGVSAPPLVITDTDKRGVIVVVTIVTLAFLLVAFLTRIWVRLRVSGPWSYDDTTLTVATIIGIGQSVAVFAEVHEGFGLTKSSLSDGDIASVGQADYASTLLYLVALGLSKCSVIALIMRLTSNRQHLVVLYINIGAAVVWALSSFLLITIACSPAQPFRDLASQCSGLFARWQYVCALDIITEISIFAMSIYLVFGLQMAIRMKAMVVLAFALRLPVIAWSATRLYYLHRQVYSDDPTLAGYLAGVWTQVQVSYSLIATAAACLGPFIRPFTKPYLAEASSGPGSSRLRTTVPDGYNLSKITGKHSGSGSDSRSRSRKSRGGSQGNSRTLAGQIYPGSTSQSTACYDPPRAGARGAQDDSIHGARAASRQSLDSHDSKKMIITKGVEWTVEYDGQDSAARAGTVGSNESSQV